MSDSWPPYPNNERYPEDRRTSWPEDAAGNAPFHSEGSPYREAGVPPEPEVIRAEFATRPPQPSRARWVVPLILFVLTCLSTFAAGQGFQRPLEGLKYSICIMAVLLSHEMGHFLQALRYGAPATLPFFLPMPFSPIGTFGAVIAMDTRRLDRRALFDIGITGPLAGLIPTLVFTVVGIQQSQVVPVVRGPAFMELGEPLLFTYLTQWIKGPLPDGYTLLVGPMAFAGWVGMLITALNLIPIGQLDGGHILYALLGKRANALGMLLLLAAIAAVVIFGYWGWLLMIFLLGLLGPEHPPTANDEAPLGWGRVILGWLVLAFIIVGFTPEPFKL
ncbi:MAG: site-2 protease family protein [Thermogutta sp.]|uniref:site-2 protease family protein n=1 Tax=Thermogutta sp. TaxID=1962930 RepID=UPI0019B6623D|nr:site-2 protease family protein [Thermogutta sp.]MBC7353492.1 site-2 protease family protein [Thermogutta sp.]